MMTPQVMGDITNSVGIANAIPDASPYLDSSVSADSIVVYPTPDGRKPLSASTFSDLKSRGVSLPT
jgi:hypothetical protein